MVHRIHTGHNGQQSLRGTNIRGRFFAADVLFACLQRQTQSFFTLHIDRYADQTTWHAAFEGIFSRHEGGVRTAETKRHTETLRVTNRNVRTPFARCFEQSQSEQIGRGDDDFALLFRLSRPRAVIGDRTARARILYQHAKAVIRQALLTTRAGAHFDAQRFGAGFDHFAGLREYVCGDVKHVGVTLAAAHGQGHGFGSGGRFIQHGRVGNIHARQVHHHLLVVQQRFQTTL